MAPVGSLLLNNFSIVAKKPVPSLIISPEHRVSTLVLRHLGVASALDLSIVNVKDILMLTSLSLDKRGSGETDQPRKDLSSSRTVPGGTMEWGSHADGATHHWSAELRGSRGTVWLDHTGL